MVIRRRTESGSSASGQGAWLSTLSSRNKPQPKQPKHLVDAMRERMKQNHENPTMVWESLWRDGITPWDLGGPTPVLLAELKEQQQHQNRSWRPTTCLIPGCGSGYDVVSLGRYLDSLPIPNTTDQEPRRNTIVGLEVTETPLQRARTIIQDSIDKDGPFSSHTTILLLQGDFFHDPSTWKLYYGTEDTTNSNSSSSSSSTATQQQQSILSSNQTFSFIFDYTFFCAIPPTLRILWGQQMQRLLAPSGKLLTLMFPYHPMAHDTMATSNNHDSHHHQGPPYLVSREMYQDTFQPPRLLMETPLPYASVATVPKRQGQEVVGWWYKAKL